MRKLYLLFLLSVFCYGPQIKCTQDFEFYNGIEDLNDDVLLQVSELPEEMVQMRELPWYIDIISKPGAYVFIKVCKFVDWLKGSATYMKKLSVGVLYQLHLKKRQDFESIKC